MNLRPRVPIREGKNHHHSSNKARKPDFCSYDGESINRLQMDIKCKTCYIRTWK
jgi:hypothetical protein